MSDNPIGYRDALFTCLVCTETKPHEHHATAFSQQPVPDEVLKLQQDDNDRTAAIDEVRAFDGRTLRNTPVKIYAELRGFAPRLIAEMTIDEFMQGKPIPRPGPLAWGEALAVVHFEPGAEEALVWQAAHPLDHEFYQDPAALFAGLCDFTYPDGERCWRTPEAHK